MSSLPGQRDVYTNQPRNVLLSSDNVILGSGVIDATYAYDGANTDKEDELRAGTILAQITSSKLWVPCKRTTVAAGGSGSGSGVSGTNMPVTDARAFKAGDTITVGAFTGNTISSIDYTNNVIILSSAIDYDGADDVYASGDLAGAETARLILNEHVKLKDDDAVMRDKFFGAGIVQGLVDNAKILGDLAAVRADTGAYLGGIVWADQQGLK